MTKELLDQITIIPPLPDCGVKLEKYLRLKCLFYVLEITDIPRDSESTLILINNTILRIEDCHSGVEAIDNPGLKYSGRMYPIHDDNVERKSNGSIVANTKGNKILIEPSGSFSILTKFDEQILLMKRHES